MTSVDCAGWYDPLVRLAGHRADVLVAGVMVEHGQVERLRRGGHQQLGELATTLTSRRQQPLHLQRAGDVRRTRLDSFEGVQRADEAVQFVSVAGGVADLEVGAIVA